MRVIREVSAGAVIEKEIFCVPDGCKLTKKTEPKEELPKTPEEKAEANRKKSERRFIRKVNSSFTSRSFYITLTYDDFALPISYEEAEKLIANFLRRLKRWQPNLRAVTVTGYGRESNRLHHHLILDGDYIDIDKLLEMWTFGSIKRAERLRHHNYYNGIDCGEDFTGLAVYLHAHSNAKTKGKRWKEAGKLSEPIKDKPRELKIELSGDKPPRAPKGYKYIGIYESGFNQNKYISFKYVRDVGLEEDDFKRGRQPFSSTCNWCRFATTIE